LKSNTANHGSYGISLYSCTNSYLNANASDNNFYYGYSDVDGINNTYKGNECSGNGLGGSDPTGLCSPQP